MKTAPKRMQSDNRHPLMDEGAASDAARGLADALRNGGWLEPVAIDGLPLGSDEDAFADLQASGWRHYALDQIAYERRTLLLGGPYLMALTGIASAIGNHRGRQAAEQAAAPRWRPLGPLRIVVTSQRLLVWFEQSWCSVWYSAITDIRPDPAGWALDIFFEEDPPYRLVGAQVALLAVILGGRLDADAGPRLQSTVDLHPVKVVSERLGHSTPAFTLQQYVRVIPGLQAEAAAQVADVVDAPGQCGHCGAAPGERGHSEAGA